MKKSLLHIISIIFSRKLISVLFVLFAVNYSLLTVNCYSQWVQQSVPTNKPIVGIKFIDTLKGWAIATNTTYDSSNILHTTNGGVNWIVQYTTTNQGEYNAICVIDSNIIYAGGFDGAATANLTKSTNGGLNWTIIPTPTNMSILDMQFLNKDSGWTCGGSIGPDVRTTTNGGLIWTVKTTGIASQTQRIFFLNYNTGFCGANTRLYETTNAGINWSLNNTFSASAMVSAIYFLNQNTGWVGLGLNKMYYTINGGINWIAQVLPPNSNLTVNDVFFLSNNIGYAGTGLNKIFKTIDSGNIWGFQIDTGGSYRISFTDTANGWTGNIGISHTTNGGGQITYVGIVNISNNIPKSFELYQNYPNPFNLQTNIRFSLTKASHVSFKIYDVQGREKSIWKSDKALEAGTHELQYDAKDLASGIYFYEIIISDEFSNTLYKQTKKMVLLK